MAVDLLIGDAAYTPQLYSGRRPAAAAGAGRRPGAWEASIGRIRATGAARVHSCHHTDVIPA